MAGTIITHHGVTPKIASSAFVAPTATVIGDVEIGEGSGIWFGAVIRGDVNRIRIGRKSNVQDNSVIHVNHDADGTGGAACVIGDGVTIGHIAMLHACTLEDGCFIGMRAIVMDHVVVESGAMVAAGAMITPGKVVRKGELWAGSPAKLMRPVTRAELDDFVYAAEHYAELARTYME